jgi:Protein of unknown function (DUF2973)
MLQLLYIIAFVVLAVLAIGNLIRSLISLGIESQRSYAPNSRSESYRSQDGLPPHPELLDEEGHIINEPLLVMRSITVEDAREQLDALYKQSPSSGDDA